LQPPVSFREAVALLQSLGLLEALLALREVPLRDALREDVHVVSGAVLAVL